MARTLRALTFAMSRKCKLRKYKSGYGFNHFYNSCCFGCGGFAYQTLYGHYGGYFGYGGYGW